MELESYLDFEKLLQELGVRSVSSLLERAGNNINEMSMHDLVQLIKMIYGKWPTNPGVTSQKFRKDLISGAKRGLQAKHYKQLYGKEPSENVTKIDQWHQENLKLSDQEYVNSNGHSPTLKKLKIKPDAKRSDNMDKPENKKENKPIDEAMKQKLAEASAKMKTMSLDELIKWAIELGVPQDRIEQHKNKPKGLAKMNIGNLIKGKIRG